MADFRSRPLDQGPYTFVAADALVLKVREGGRVINVHALVATGVNGDGHREILGLQVTSAENGAGWLGFFRDLTARGLSGVRLVTSDAHRGLVDAIGATLPGASWQRCRTHWAFNEISSAFVLVRRMMCYARAEGRRYLGLEDPVELGPFRRNDTPWTRAAHRRQDAFPQVNPAVQSRPACLWNCGTRVPAGHGFWHGNPLVP